MTSITAQLANKVSAIKYQDLSENSIQIAKQFLLDYLGNSIRGWTQPNMTILADVLGVSSDGTHAIMFNGQKAATNSVLHAAMLNSAASHSLDFDDLHNASIIHLACVIAPSVLAVAEDENLSGRDILAAVVAGYEAGARIGESVNPESYHFWHTTSTVGGFAAAVAVGNLLKLNGEQMIHCLGTAGTQAAGLWEFLIDGAMSKTLHIAKANLAGIISAKLAKQGFTAAKKILEGEKGFCLAMLPKPHWEAFTAPAQGAYKIEENSFKPYACCKHTHPGNYAAQLLRTKYNLQLHDVKSIHVKGNSIVKNLVDNNNPATPYGSKFSLQYCIAAAIKYGKLGVDQFNTDNLHDPDIQRVMHSTTIEVDPVIETNFRQNPATWSVDLTITDIHGNTYHKFIQDPKGDPPNPMTWEDSVEKFMTLAEPIYGQKVCKKLCRLINTLEQHDKIKKSLNDCFI